MPGGFGTLDELSESLTLVQTGRMGKFPVVMFGKEFWKPLEAMFDNMAKEGYIDEDDKMSYFITDSIEEAVDYIEEFRLMHEHFKSE
jgi:hypothetical protein